MPVAITFDDGPSPYTGYLLDVLDVLEVKATFFLVGSRAGMHPYTDIIARGHEIGNHTYTHLNIDEAESSDIEAELLLTQEAFGMKPKLFRPPGGAYNPGAKQIVESVGLELVMWTRDSQDWKGIGHDDIAWNALHDIKDGDIILFHDYADGSIDPEAMFAALPTIAIVLKAKFGLATVSELLHG